MTQSNSAVDDAAIVSPDRVRMVVQGVLRAATNSGWTDAALEAACGVKARTIKAYRVEGKEPSLSNALSILLVLGASALNPVLATIGYVGRPLDEADSTSPALIAASILPHLAVIAQAGADNHIDHLEEPACRDAADQIIATVLPLSRAGRAA